MAFDPMNEILYRLRQGQGKHVTLEAGNSLCLFGFFQARSMLFAFISICSICSNPASRFDLLMIAVISCSETYLLSSGLADCFADVMADYIAD